MLIMANKKNRACLNNCGTLIWDTPKAKSTGLCKRCWATDRKLSAETIEKLSGENSPNWKGDKVGYHALHYWVRKYLGAPNKCESCGTIEAKRFEWANISGKYKRDISDWARLCSSCHHTFDGTVRNFIK